MNTSSLPRLRLLGAVLALAAVVAVTGLLATSDTAYAQTFNPCGILALADTSPGANSDINSTFGVGIGADCQALPVDPSDPPDLQFGATVNFTPPQWGVYRDADIPDGAIVAFLKSNATLGLIGDGCSNRLNPEFDMMDATTNMSVLVPFFDPEEEIDDPNTPEKDPDLEDKRNEPDDQFDIGPDGLPLGVTRYPDYLTRILEGEGGPGDTLQPITRLYGQTEVASIEVSLNFVVFEPGTVFRTRAGEVRRTDPRLGYPSVTVLQFAGDPDTEPDIEDANAVSDFCSPLQADTTLFGVSKDNPDSPASDEAGHPVRTNPPDGTYNFVTFAVSQRDNDNDGIENMMDPCPFTADNDWDPRKKINDPAYTGDNDGDSLPNSCDPEPNVKCHLDPGGVYDCDEDRYGNRGDNCPLVANSAGQLGGKSEPPAAADDNQEDNDLDAIGDACDDNPNVADGWRAEVCLVSQVTIGAGGPAPDPAPQDLQPCGDMPVETPTPTPPPDGIDGNGDGDGHTATPTPTPATSDDGDMNGPAPGVGSLAPVASSIPAWATIISALGGAGLLGSLGALAARIFGIRLPGRRD